MALLAALVAMENGVQVAMLQQVVVSWTKDQAAVSTKSQACPVQDSSDGSENSTLEPVRWTCPASHAKSEHGNRAAVSLHSDEVSARTHVQHTFR